MRLVPVFGEGFMCIAVVCLSAMTLQSCGVDSVALQASTVESDVLRGSSQEGVSWNGK